MYLKKYIWVINEQLQDAQTDFDAIFLWKDRELRNFIQPFYKIRFMGEMKVFNA
jgi:hypothetical protein